MQTLEWEELRAFRHQLYMRFGCRRDALFDLLDALLSAPSIETPAHLSLAPSCQRGWGSVYDALNAGTMDLGHLEALIASYPLATERAWYAVDASVWPRCDAETSPERGYYPHPYRHSHGQPIVAGWNYSWLVQLLSRCSSWTAPLRLRRMRPGENANAVAAEQIRSWRRHAPPTLTAPPPIVSFDAGYDSVQLSLTLADEPVCLLVRLRSGRCFYADPTSQPPTGRPRRHGAKFVCDDATTWPAPTAAWSTDDPQYGHVQLQAWSGLHPIPQLHAQRGTRTQPHARPLVRGTLIRLEVERLPRPTKVPQPLWFWWWGPIPPNLAEVWQAYVARYAIEHSFRFFKQTLKWTTPKLRRPEAADRWTWLLVLAYVQLRLARDLVSEVRLPWQRPLPPERRTPARVRRGFSSLLAYLGSPASVPKPCGRSPGRPKGKRSPPAQHFPAIKLSS
ncbi:MAG TPA: NF041680 family putative transposase [Ktedonobacterales bacterium]|nr:NF041680 family putative transposase [Ktedonobacterales bacterium]